ncbi:MAG: T9SS type A sorting domain-containing protein [Saprospiraceae bacterium]|nr:T9SS type A sorting domain-containing protein [Saprospiraceae bacterium]
MKKSTLFCCLLMLAVVSKITAQNPGCDGVRYINDVFTTVKKTTVNYAPTVGHMGNAMTLAMDIYEPEGDNLSARPAVVLAHGGSFVLGDKSSMQPWCELLARKGYVAVSIQYRLFPFFTLGFPDSLDIFDTAVKAVGDMRAAARFLREDAATTNLYRIDASNVFIGGYSAGAVTALHCGMLDENDEVPAFLQTIIDNNGGLEGVSGTVSNRTYPSDSKAIVNMSGGLYRKEWVGADNLPLVSIHGTADGTVNYVYGLAAGIAYLEGSSLLHAQAESVGLWNFLQTVPGGGHTDVYSDVQYQSYRDTFWLQATNLLESLSCALVDVDEATIQPENWSVFPNPNAGGSFIVQLPETVESANIKVSDLLGKTIFEVKNIKNQSVVPLQNLPAGTYFIQIQNPAQPAQRFAAQRLIRQ